MQHRTDHAAPTAETEAAPPWRRTMLLVTVVAALALGVAMLVIALVKLMIELIKLGRH